MKNIITVILIAIIVLFFISCVTPAKIEYFDFPSDIAEEAKIANAKMIERGKILYNINCSKCHNKKEKRKIILPDFTYDQLESYTIRIKNETHVNTLPESRISAEELQAIQFFFSYKKPSTGK
jgi:hypothetical protein